MLAPLLSRGILGVDAACARSARLSSFAKFELFSLFSHSTVSSHVTQDSGESQTQETRDTTAAESDDTRLDDRLQFYESSHTVALISSTRIRRDHYSCSVVLEGKGHYLTNHYDRHTESYSSVSQYGLRY